MLRVDSILIPLISGFDVRQSFDPIQARTQLRTRNGTGVLQHRWQKLSSTITGNGALPEGLDGLNPALNHTVHSISPLAVVSPNTVLTIPRTYRNDLNYVPQCAALVGDEYRPTPCTVIGQAVTATAVAGASQYIVRYFPVITGMVTLSWQNDASSVGGLSWSLQVDEA